MKFRELTFRVLTWGDADAPKLFMLHGWMDVAASFQFLVDALAGRWCVIAPDLRGFGQSAWMPDGYRFADYIADLDAWLDHFSPHEPVRLIGHSLGGNVVMHYAGVRPARVAQVVSLEGFGIPAEKPDRAPAKIAKWLDALKKPVRFRDYDDIDGVVEKLIEKNPRLTRDKALYLAHQWAEVGADGRARLRSDPRHKVPFPTVYRMDEVYAIWSRIEAETLWVAALDSHIPEWLQDDPTGECAPEVLAGVKQRIRTVPHARLATIADAGHMLHHDQPTLLAREIEAFLRQ